MPAAWMAASVYVGLYHQNIVIELAVAALFLPWFFLCSKAHEREFLWAKAADVLRMGRA